MGNGIRMGSWGTLDLSAAFPGQGSNVDFYEGAVSAIFEGGADPNRPEGNTTTIVRVIEVE